MLAGWLAYIKPFNSFLVVNGCQAVEGRARHVASHAESAHESCRIAAGLMVDVRLFLIR